MTGDIELDSDQELGKAIGTAVSELFCLDTPAGGPDLFGEKFFMAYIEPIGELACEAACDWVEEHKNRFSDPLEAVQRVLQELQEIKIEWNAQFKQYLGINGIHNARAGKGDMPLAKEQFRAMGESMLYTYHTLTYTLNFEKIMVRRVRDRNWQYRPQAELVYKLCALYMERQAVWSHATMSIGFVGSESPWMQYVSGGLNVVINEGKKANLPSTAGWVGADADSWMTGPQNKVIGDTVARFKKENNML